MPSSPTARAATLWIHALLLAAACLPLISLLTEGPGFLAHPHSELPVRLWCIDAFPEIGLLGGLALGIGHPTPGPLNNPDVVGTVVIGLLRPLLGLAGAWNALVVGLLFANMATTRALVRAWLDDEAAALTAALGVGLMPLALSYGLASAIVDMLNLWPYSLGLWALLALRRGQSPVRHGAIAGLAAAAALVSSPYALVVALAGLPIGALLLAPRWLPELREPALRRAWGRGLLALVVVGGLLGGAYALKLRSVMAAPDSQMSSEYVAFTRNAPPWQNLRPEHPGQIVAPLSEFLAMGRGALRQRDTASHYMRTVSLTGSLASLALLGALVGRRSGARAWAVLALCAALIATGPFLALGPNLALDRALNPFFFYAHYLAPGGRLLLETFRYGFLAAFATAMAAAGGVAWLRARGGPWRRLAWLAPVAFLAELVLVSPVPLPLPVAQLSVDPAYARLDEILAPGAIVELPFTEGDTGRFSRIHFFQQRRHRRPIADVVRGWPPDLVLDNDLLRILVAAEALEDPPPPGQPPPPPPPPYDPRNPPAGYRRLKLEAGPELRAQEGRALLLSQGFVGLVIDPAAYTSKASLDRVLEVLGPGTVTLEGRLVHPLVRGGALKPGAARP